MIGERQTGARGTNANERVAANRGERLTEAERASRERQKVKLECWYASNGDERYIFESRPVIDNGRHDITMGMMKQGRIPRRAEKNLLAEIAGPAELRGVESVFQRLDGNKHEQRILGMMTDGKRGFDNYENTDERSVEKFLRKYETPIDFEEEAADFLEMIEQVNGPKKRAEYDEAMESFQKKVYGKKWEYYEAMRELHEEAEREMKAERMAGKTVTVRKEAAPVARHDRGERERRREVLIKDCGAAMLNKGELIGEPERTCEDNLYADIKAGVFAVFDGAGGGGGNPARAAMLAAREVAGAVDAMVPETTDDLRSALEMANYAVLKDHSNKELSEKNRAGITTGVVGRVIEDGGRKKLIWANVGDSRIYVIRNGDAIQVTKDEGYGNAITNALGDEECEARQGGEVMLREGDRLVFCSDGVTGDVKEDFIPTREMARIVERAKNADEAAAGLIRRATKIDDRTAIVVRV